MANTTFHIHPAIGIARVGNSDDYYLAPEIPGAIPPPGTEFKDESGAIKRQAARFRIFRYEDGKAVEEIVSGQHATIRWRVHLANRKAAWYEFWAAMDLAPGLSKTVPRRNACVQGGDRNLLAIDAGNCEISGPNQKRPLAGWFMNNAVALGELRTDSKGRLLVLGAHGVSASTSGKDPTDDANNDTWYDDTADGPVRATVTYQGKECEAQAAFAIVGPPNYCQGISPVVSLYDVVSELFLSAPRRVEFYRDIYPIFERLVRCQWVNEGIYISLGFHSPADFTSAENQKVLSDPGTGSRSERQRIFRWFRGPDEVSRRGCALPPLYGDAYDFPTHALYELSLTRRQYACLKLWADGHFDAGNCNPPPDTSVASQISRLDRAALDDCLGGPFHPGSEAPWILRRRSLWESPFRLRLSGEGESVKDDYGDYLTPEVCLSASGPLHSSGPGTLGRWLAVPWQTDVVSCHAGYPVTSNAPLTYLPLPSFWAARVPNFVVPQEALDRLASPNVPPQQKFKHFSRRLVWYRDITGSSYNDRIKNAIQSWNKLGIVAPRAKPDGTDFPNPLFIETQRAADPTKDATLRQLKIAEGDAQP
jgi:hypothetical protein